MTADGRNSLSHMGWWKYQEALGNFHLLALAPKAEDEYLWGMRKESEQRQESIMQARIAITRANISSSVQGTYLRKDELQVLGRGALRTRRCDDDELLWRDAFETLTAPGTFALQIF